MPVSNTPLNYNASLLKASEDLSYEFTVKPKDNMKMDMLLASLELHSSSVFQIKQDAAGMAVSTNLNGVVSVNAGGTGTIALLLPELKFNNMALGNRNPVTKKEEFYFNADTWSFSPTASSCAEKEQPVGDTSSSCSFGSSASRITLSSSKHNYPCTVLLSLHLLLLLLLCPPRGRRRRGDQGCKSSCNGGSRKTRGLSFTPT